ncbi:aspartate/glutamate racemase family protein [Alteromonas antoniana]|uniref:aspartate/glutamate racemase family protein n=1 Tax=Alteromonas antoniana TaxID=2803813 RepID=UPI001C46087F|nr:aspartate/glutamate racemase family protein [Alteromonas antoniana]
MSNNPVRIGIIGGMSWQSTQSYYQQINQQVAHRLGGLHSADLLIHSVDFEQISQWQHDNNWGALTEALCHSASLLCQGGAQAIVIATNTMHKVAGEVALTIPVPLIHIADATAKRCHHVGALKVGLLGTRFTMEQAFYRDRLAAHQLDVVVPDEPDREVVHSIIYEELCKGIINNASQQRYLEIIQKLRARGAEAIVLGCTEIGLLVKQENSPIPLIDTTAEHVAAIVDRICQK